MQLIKIRQVSSMIIHRHRKCGIKNNTLTLSLTTKLDKQQAIATHQPRIEYFLCTFGV